MVGEWWIKGANLLLTKPQVTVLILYVSGDTWDFNIEVLDLLLGLTYFEV